MNTRGKGGRGGRGGQSSPPGGRGGRGGQSSPSGGRGGRGGRQSPSGGGGGRPLSGGSGKKARGQGGKQGAAAASSDDSQDSGSQAGSDDPETQQQLFAARGNGGGSTPTTPTTANSTSQSGSQGADANANAGDASTTQQQQQQNSTTSNSNGTQQQPPQQQPPAPQANNPLSAGSQQTPAANANNDAAVADLLARLIGGSAKATDDLPNDLVTEPPDRPVFTDLNMLSRSEYKCYDLTTDAVFAIFGHFFRDLKGDYPELKECQRLFEDLPRTTKGIMCGFLSMLSGSSTLSELLEIDTDKTPETVFGRLEQLASLFHTQMINHYGSAQQLDRFRITKDQLIEYVQYWAPGTTDDLEESLLILRQQRQPVKPVTFGDNGMVDAHGRPVGPGARAYDLSHGHLDPKTKTSIDAKTPSKSGPNQQAAKLFADSIVRANGNLREINIETMRLVFGKMSQTLGWHSPHDSFVFVLQSYSSFAEQFNSRGRVVLPLSDAAASNVNIAFPLPSQSCIGSTNKDIAEANFLAAKRRSTGTNPTSQDVLTAYAWNTGNDRIAEVLKLAVAIIKQRLAKTSLQGKSETLEASVETMTRQTCDRPMHGLYFMDHTRADIEEDILLMIKAGAGSLGLGVFAEIVTKLFTVDADAIKSEVPTFVVDVKNACSLPPDATGYDVLNAVNLQTQSNSKDPRHHNRLFLHPVLMQIAVETFLAGHITAECHSRPDYLEMEKGLISRVKDFDNMTIKLEGKSVSVSQTDRVIAMLISQRMESGVGLPWDDPMAVIEAMKTTEPDCLKDISFLHGIASTMYEDKRLRAVDGSSSSGKKPQTRGSAPFDAAIRAKGVASMALSLGDAGGSGDTQASSTGGAQANAARERNSGAPYKEEASGPFSDKYSNNVRATAKSKYAKMAPLDLYNKMTDKNGRWSGPQILEQFFTINEGKLSRTPIGGPSVKTSAWYEQASLDRNARLILNNDCTPDNWYALCRARALQRSQNTTAGKKEANLALEHDVLDAAPISNNQFETYMAAFANFKEKREGAKQRSQGPSTDKKYKALVTKFEEEIEQKERARAEAAENVKKRQAAAASSPSGTTTTEITSDGSGA